MLAALACFLFWLVGIIGLTLFYPHSLSLSHSLTHSSPQSHSLSHSLNLSLTLYHTHTLSLTHTLCKLTPCLPCLCSLHLPTAATAAAAQSSTSGDTLYPHLCRYLSRGPAQPSALSVQLVRCPRLVLVCWGLRPAGCRDDPQGRRGPRNAYTNQRTHRTQPTAHMHSSSSSAPGPAPALGHCCSSSRSQWPASARAHARRQNRAARRQGMLGCEQGGQGCGGATWAGSVRCPRYSHARPGSR